MEPSRTDAKTSTTFIFGINCAKYEKEHQSTAAEAED